jgi:protein-tyrosine-phosphatase
MAKAIFLQLIEGIKPRPSIDVRAAGLGPVSGIESSYAARYVIREMYGKDLLKEHRPELLDSDLVAQADLILVMDKSLLLTPGKTLPPGKTFLLKEFLGLQGEILDPWPDGKDAATLQRYRICGEELRTILSAHIDRILKVLEV